MCDRHQYPGVELGVEESLLGLRWTIYLRPVMDMDAYAVAEHTTVDGDDYEVLSAVIDRIGRSMESAGRAVVQETVLGRAGLPAR